MRQMAGSAALNPWGSATLDSFWFSHFIDKTGEGIFL